MAISWLLLQLGSILFPVLNLNVAYQRILLSAFIVIFPLWLIFTWFYDIAAEGVVKSPVQNVERETSDQRFNLAIIGILSAAVFLLVADRIFGNQRCDE